MVSALSIPDTLPVEQREESKPPLACDTVPSCTLFILPAHVLKDFKKAMEVLDTSCSGGLADSCNMLAKQLLRQDGKGPTPRDPPRAKALLEKGCSHNHGPSCYNLTVMLKNGDEGVPRCVCYVRYFELLLLLLVVAVVVDWLG